MLHAAHAVHKGAAVSAKESQLVTLADDDVGACDSYPLIVLPHYHCHVVVGK